MEELNQLEMFMAQLEPKGPAEDSDEKEGDGKRRKKKGREGKRGAERDACIRVSASTLRKAKLLAFWMDENGVRNRPSLLSIMEEAVDYLIEGRYPKAKKFTER